MKLIGKIFLTCILAMLLMLVIVCISLQTRWGAESISRWISDGSPYHFSTSKIEYKLATPLHLVLYDVKFSQDNQPITLMAEKIDVGFSLTQLANPYHFRSIELHKGQLDLEPVAEKENWSIQADRLQLNNMAIMQINKSITTVTKMTDAENVNGGITPWIPQPQNIVGENARFRMSAGSVSLGDIQASNVIVEGQTTPQKLIFNNIGGNLAQGSITANAERDIDGHWTFANLRLNDMRLQTDKSLRLFLRPLQELSISRLDNVSMNGIHLQGTDWALVDFNLSLKKLTLENKNGLNIDGSVTMHANSLIFGQLKFDDPILTLKLSPEEIEIKQLSSRWANGLIRTTGHWTGQKGLLALDELAIAGLEYTLPEDWRNTFNQPLPHWLNTISVKKISGTRNLIIDVNPDYPFQMTALDISGQDLLLAHQRQWGLWSGNLLIGAAQATFNAVDLRYPSLTILANDKEIKLSKISAFTYEGILEGQATLDQTSEYPLSLILEGRSVPVTLFNRWGWPETPLLDEDNSDNKRQEDGNLTLQLQGKLRSKNPFKATANGTLSINLDNRKIEQKMLNGQIE